MKDIDEMICSEMYECCKDNMESMSHELVYEMGAYETYDDFLKDVRSSSDIALWALCHILDGYGDEGFVEDMQLSWVEEEYIDYEGYDDIVYHVSDGDEKRYFRIGFDSFDSRLTYTYYSYEVKKVTKTITVWE